MSEPRELSLDDIGAVVRSALNARAEAIKVAPSEIRDRVATAGRVAAGSRRLGPTLRLTLIAIVIAMGVVLAVSLVGGSVPRPSVSPGPTPSPSPSAFGAEGPRDPTGVPEMFDGQPVFIGLSALFHANATTDATPFLVGGWYGDGSRQCAGPLPPPGEEWPTLLKVCEDSVDPGAPSTFGNMYWGALNLPDDRGPSIVEAHTHDVRSSECPPDLWSACIATIVVDNVLWTGDDWTRTAPLSVTTALERSGALYGSWIPNSDDDGASFVTSSPAPCPSPWPHEVYTIHGDPRYGLLAVFPDETSRVAAQSALDPAAPTCLADPRILRPGAPHWIGFENVLELVYGTALDAGIIADFNGQATADLPRIPPVPPSFDQSYRTVDDAEAGRASGNLDATLVIADETPANWYDVYLQNVDRRFNANALTYSIGPARVPTAADVAPDQWTELKKYAVPGTPRLFEVDHPNSTDPTLVHETLVAYEAGQNWLVMLVQPLTSSSTSPVASGAAP